MKVTAISPAFYNGARVRVGDVLDVPDGFKASWATAAESVKATPKATKPAKPEPRALSQAGKEEAKSFIQAHSEKADLA
jgi:hypothetical protein